MSPPYGNCLHWIKWIVILCCSPYLLPVTVITGFHLQRQKIAILIKCILDAFMPIGCDLPRAWKQRKACCQKYILYSVCKEVSSRTKITSLYPLFVINIYVLHCSNSGKTIFHLLCDIQSFNTLLTMVVQQKETDTRNGDKDKRYFVFLWSNAEPTDPTNCLL